MYLEILYLIYALTDTGIFLLCEMGTELHRYKVQKLCNQLPIYLLFQTHFYPLIRLQKNTSGALYCLVPITPFLSSSGSTKFPRSKILISELLGIIYLLLFMLFSIRVSNLANAMFSGCLIYFKIRVNHFLFMQIL